MNFIYYTTLGQAFSIEKYSKALTKVMKNRNIVLNVRHNLIKVDTDTRKATFEILNNEAKPTGETKEIEVFNLYFY